MNGNADIIQEAPNGAERDISALLVSAMQAKRTQIAIEAIPAGEKLTWNTTPEQIARINAGEREALDEFYFNPENHQRLLFSAYRYMRNNAYVKVVANYEDLMQQVYCDLRTGIIQLRPYDKAISRAIFHSFRFAPVGGEDELYIPFQRAEA